MASSSSKRRMASSSSTSSNRRMASSSMAPSSSSSSNRRTAPSLMPSSNRRMASSSSTSSNGRMASSSMDSSSSKRSSYDVFLSFRGEDVRKTFLGHLYTALVEKGIHTYKDDKNLRTGEQISPALMKAIEESRIAIVVFSENYASSTWCLDELTKIMECKKERDLTVFPVFYKVDPREVRTPRQSYRKAMDKHKNKFMKDLGKVQRWKEALPAAGKLSGLHFTDGDEAELIKNIVRKISTQLGLIPLRVATFPVGLDSRVQEVRTILNLQSKDDVLMVGLWGPGGVGKTTLAEAIYNDMCGEFQCCSFLACVRENSSDLIHLQEKLLSEALLGEQFPIHSVSKGSQMIKHRLCNKKALIILDDVDDNSQLNNLVMCEWFGPGSRIIITTRNKQLLISHGIHHDRIYEVEVLKNYEALKLFRAHTFRGNQKVEIRSELVDMVLDYAGGLPLALEVSGSLLCGKEQCEWERIIRYLSTNPDKRIEDVLRVSYEELDEDTQEIFLDITCFFKGHGTKYIVKVLDSCYFDTTTSVEILIERSLIREDDWNFREEDNRTLQMHDLIQSMGMKIVKKGCRNDPEKCSRLWLYDDVHNVLSTNSGTDKIRAIALRLPKQEEMNIGPDAFTNMRKLRLLILHNVQNTFVGPIHLPNELRWLEWPQCTSTPKFGDGPKKLVGVDLQNTNIEGMLKHFKDFKKLKFINFSECQSLICMPDIDCTPNLEELDLSGCKYLEHAHESIAHHGKLKSLDLSWCSKFRHLPDAFKSKNLRHLILTGCSKLQRLPDSLGKAKHLQELKLSGTSVKELPASIENLVSLKKLYLYFCQELMILPSSIYWLQNLEWLDLSGCPKLIKFPKKEVDTSDAHMKTGFPKLRVLELGHCNLSEVEFLESPSCFPLLRELQMSGNNFTILSSCGQLNDLLKLVIFHCQQLQEIRGIPRRLRRLWVSDCKSLCKISSDIYRAGTIYLGSCQELAYDELIKDTFKLENIRTKFDLVDHDDFDLNVILPGQEMLEWLVPNNEGHIYFIAPNDLFEKFIGLAFCVVLVSRGKGHVAHFQWDGAIDGNTREYVWHQGYREQRNKGNGFGVASRLSRYKQDRTDSDHVWLQGYREQRNKGNGFGPNDWRHFQFIIKTSFEAIVKKCGFLLIWKPLGKDLEVLLKYNPWLHPNVIYQLGHEDSQTSTMEESSNEREDLLGSKTIIEASNQVLRALDDFSLKKWRYSLIDRRNRNVCLGGEMPEEFIPVEDGTICFRASQDLYNKFRGLAICIIFIAKDGKNKISFDIEPYLDGQMRNVLSGTLDSSESDHMWIEYLETNVLWGFLEGGVDFDQFDKRDIQFSLRLRISDGTMKKMGYVVRCMPLEDDLKAVLEDDQSLNLTSLYEDSIDESKQLHSLFPSREFLRRFHLHIDEPKTSDSETDQTKSGDSSSSEED